MPSFAGLRVLSVTLASLKLRASSLLGILLLTLAFSGVSDAQATNVVLFSTMGTSAAPTATGITSLTASASPSIRYAQPFVAAATGPVGIVSLWAQCTWSGVGNLCSPSGTGEITIAADNGGAPGTSLTATSQFQSPVSTGGSPICAPTLSNPTLTAGVTYWAVLASAGQTSWLFQDNTPGGPLESTDGGASWHAAPTNKRLSLKVESAAACGPLAVPNPVEGSALDRIITAPGAKANSNISIGNQGSADLSITSASFGGANPSVFSLYQLFDVSANPILWQPTPSPRACPLVARKVFCTWSAPVQPPRGTTPPPSRSTRTTPPMPA